MKPQKMKHFYCSINYFFQNLQFPHNLEFLSNVQNYFLFKSNV